jgi:hypothetical protein
MNLKTVAFLTEIKWAGKVALTCNWDNMVSRVAELYLKIAVEKRKRF